MGQCAADKHVGSIHGQYWTAEHTAVILVCLFVSLFTYWRDGVGGGGEWLSSFFCFLVKEMWCKVTAVYWQVTGCSLVFLYWELAWCTLASLAVDSVCVSTHTLTKTVCLSLQKQKEETRKQVCKYFHTVHMKHKNALPIHIRNTFPFLCIVLPSEFPYRLKNSKAYFFSACVGF